MRNKILTVLTIILITTSGLNFVSAQNEPDNFLIDENEEEIDDHRPTRQRKTAEDEQRLQIESNSSEISRIGEKVKALENGYRNISFDDGYNGYCVNYNLQSTSRGETFIVENTSSITSSKYGESVGNYLKILFVDHYNYTMNPTTDLSQVIWTFTDYDYKNSNNEIVKAILESAANGRIIPDHGAVAKINATTEALFDFESLNSQYYRTQNFFGYKITYRTIEINEDEVLESTPENNTTEQNQTIPENNTTEQNQTIPENNTTEQNQTIPENNTTEQNQTIPENNTTEQNQTIPENNTTEEKETVVEEKNSTNNSTIVIPLESNETSEIAKTMKNESSDVEKTTLNKHETGIRTTLALVMLLILGCIIIIKYKRD